MSVASAETIDAGPETELELGETLAVEQLTLEEGEIDAATLTTEELFAKARAASDITNSPAQSGEPDGIVRITDVNRDELAYAALGDWLRDRSPGADLSDSVAFHSKETGLVGFVDEAHGLEKVNLQIAEEDGAVVAARVALVTKKADETEESVILPSKRGFASTTRDSSGGTASPVCYAMGCIEAKWIKDKVNDSTSSADWWVYSVWAEATPANVNIRIFDVDVMNQFTYTTETDGRILDPRVDKAFPSVTSSCRSYNVSISSVVGVSVPIRSCNRTSLRRYLPGGMHSEFHNSNESYVSRIQVGHMIEVKTKQGKEPYWKDYADASFIQYGVGGRKFNSFDNCAYQTPSCWY